MISSFKFEFSLIENVIWEMEVTEANMKILFANVCNTTATVRDAEISKWEDIGF